ncbi:MAG: flavin reductase family protein [Pseudomonadota bacterium]
MFYEPKNGHGLKHNPFNAIVAPRPIAWVATRGTDGRDNLAPYSFFNAVAYDPPQVMFASTSVKDDRGDTKDSVAQIRETHVFSISVVEYAARDQMNASSAPLAAHDDEFETAGVIKAECETISCPRVATAPATLECQLTQIVTLPGAANFTVFGEVTGIHIRDDAMVDGRFDVTGFKLLTRMGYVDYATIAETFTLNRPK